MEWTKLSDRITSEYELVQRVPDHPGVYLMSDQKGAWVFLKVVEGDQMNFDVLARLYETPVAGINGILEYFVEGGLCYIIKAYVHGMDLYQYVETEGVLNESQVASLLRDLYQVLSKLYGDYGYVFRDLHPKNIMVTNEGFILVDSESVSSIEEAPSGKEHVRGVVGFMAPEQYGFSHATLQTDIYSLGMIAKFALTGALPSISHNDIDLSMTQISRELLYLLQKATAFSPEKRFKSYEEFDRGLKRVEKGSRLRLNHGFEWLAVLAVIIIVLLEFTLNETALASEDLVPEMTMSPESTMARSVANYGSCQMEIREPSVLAGQWRDLSYKVVGAPSGAVAFKRISIQEDVDLCYLRFEYDSKIDSHVTFLSKDRMGLLQSTVEYGTARGANDWAVALSKDLVNQMPVENGHVKIIVNLIDLEPFDPAFTVLELPEGMGKRAELDLGQSMNFRRVANADGMNFGYFDLAIEAVDMDGWMPLELENPQALREGIAHPSVAYQEDQERIYFQVAYQADDPSDVIIFTAGDQQGLQTRLYDFSRPGANEWIFSVDRDDWLTMGEISDSLVIKLFSEECHGDLMVTMPKLAENKKSTD